MATTHYGLPIVATSATVDVPRDLNALANAVDTAIWNAAVPIRADWTPTLIWNNGATSMNFSVTFAPALSASPDAIVLTLGTGTVSAVFAKLVVKPGVMSATGFTLTSMFTDFATSASTSFYVNYVAVTQAGTPRAVRQPQQSNMEGLRSAVVTCRQSGCLMDGIALPDVYVGEADDPLWGGVYCGACHTEITDIE